MQGKFISNLFLSLFLNLLVKPISVLFIDAEVQNRVGAADYGLYFSLLNLSVLFNIIIDLGINNYTIRTMAQDPHLAAKHAGRIVVLRLILFSFYLVFTTLLAFIIGYQGNELLILLILLCNQLLIMFTAYARSYFSGLHYFKTDAVISILDRFLLIVICGALLFTSISENQFFIEWYIWIQTICYLITAIIAFILLSKIIRLNHFSFDQHFSKAVIKESLPYAILILLMLLYTRSDSVIIERLHENGKVESGIYAQGFRLMDALYMFGMVFVMLLFPMFSRFLKHSKHEIIPLLQTSGNLLIGGCGVLVITLIFNASTILGWIYDSNIQESSSSFHWLMLGFFAISINFIFGTLLSANGNFKTLNYLAAFAVVFNLSLNLIFSPKYGSFGASIIFFLTQIGVSIAQFFIAKKIISFKIIPALLVKHLFILLVVLLIGIFIQEGLFLFTFQLFIGLLLMFLLKIIDVKELKQSFISPKETYNNN